MKYALTILALLSLTSSPSLALGDHLEGRLTLDVRSAKLETRVLRDDIDVTKNAKSRWSALPEFSFAFVQEGEAIIPMVSGAIASDHPNWEWVLSPGEIIPIKDGISLSLPVALMEKNENCIHNGVLSVAINKGYTSTKAHFSIASETCLYVKFDMEAEIDAEWSNEPQEDTTSIIAVYKREQAHNLPIKPITDLITAYPDVKLEGIAESKRIKPENMSHFGVLLDGVHYVSDCQTRTGMYPHCDQMPMPSYSFAKSLVASFALMRLEKLYPGVGQLQISDYVPECHSDAWKDVRFIDALNMTTGNYNDTKPEADEDSKAYIPLFLTKTHGDKIKFTCEHFPHKSAPGEVFVYHTSDTYILGTALNAFWREKKGTDGDFFDDVIVKDIFEPLGLSASAKWTRRTYDDTRQPFTGWGLLLNRNDLAKLVWFIGGHNKVLKPYDIFATQHYTSVMQSNQSDRGMIAWQIFRPHASGLIKYNKGFWAYNIQQKLGCDKERWLPYLSGYGGLSAVILPNEMGFYNVSDGGKHAFVDALYELNKIRPLCEGAKQ